MGGTRQAGPDPVRATAVGPQGQRISLNEAKGDTVVDLGGALGSTKASVWADLGYLVKDTVNGGYRLPEEPQGFNQPAPANKQDQPVPQPPVVEPAVDLTSVKGTTSVADHTLLAVQQMAPANYEAMIESAARGKDVNYKAIANDLGVEDGGESVENMVGEFREAGIQVLRVVDPTINPLAFEKFVQRDPGKASDILRAVLSHDMGPLAKAAREYSQVRNTMIEQKVEAANVVTKRENGVLMISRASLGLAPTVRRGDFGGETYISLAQAIREGHVEIAE